MGETRNAHILVRKYEKSSWKTRIQYIKLYRNKRIWYETVDWIHLAQDRDQ